MKRVILTDEQHRMMLFIYRVRVQTVKVNHPPSVEEEQAIVDALEAATDIQDTESGERT